MKANTLRQPIGLPILFFAEMWERFGFYTIQTLFILYLTSNLNFSDIHAYGLYSAFTALLYASPVIGGYLADRVMGFQRSIIFGSILYLVGYALMLSHNKALFYLSLALLVCGNGFFKANVSSLLGTLYKNNDVRRDSGFTLFYMGINLGGFIAPIIAPIVAVRYGYHYGFACAGIGMIFGLTAFLSGRRYLNHHGLQPLYDEHHNIKKDRKHQRKWVYFLTLPVIIGLSFLIPHSRIVNDALMVFGVGAIIYVLGWVVLLKNKQEKLHLLALLILIIISVSFWGFYMLLYSSLNLFAARNVDLVVFGYHIPPATLQAITPFFIITLAPLFAKMWVKIAPYKWAPSLPMKFAIGLFFTALCFYSLKLGIGFLPSGVYLIPIIWMVLSGLFRTFGELSLSPIGLSAVTRLAPDKLAGTMMGIWFLATAASLSITDKLADIAAIPKNDMSPAHSLAIYSHAFSIYTVSSLIIFAVIVALSPILKWMINYSEK